MHNDILKAIKEIRAMEPLSPSGLQTIDQDVLEPTQGDFSESEDSASTSSGTSEESSDESENEEDVEFEKLPKDSPHSMEATLYRDGLMSMAEVIAGSLKKDYPFLAAEKSNSSSTWPPWMNGIKNSGFKATPSCAMVLMVKKMDKVFLELHGEDVDRQKFVTKR